MSSKLPVCSPTDINWAKVCGNTFSLLNNFVRDSPEKTPFFILSNHAAAIKSLSAELKKCEIQGGSITLKTGTVVQCTKSGTSTAAFATAYIAHLNAEGFKNPYDTAQNAFNSTGTSTGQTIISVNGSTITLTTRYLESDGTTVTPITTTVTDERG